MENETRKRLENLGCRLEAVGDQWKVTFPSGNSVVKSADQLEGLVKSLDWILELQALRESRRNPSLDQMINTWR